MAHGGAVINCGLRCAVYLGMYIVRAKRLSPPIRFTAPVYLFFKAMVRRVTRPQNSPMMNMKPTNDMRTRKKNFFDGDVTTWEYNCPKSSGGWIYCKRKLN